MAPKKGLHGVLSPFHLNLMATPIVEVTTFEEDYFFNQQIFNEHGMNCSSSIVGATILVNVIILSNGEPDMNVNFLMWHFGMPSVWYGGVSN